MAHHLRTATPLGMASPAGTPTSQPPSLWAEMVQAPELQQRDSRCRSYHKVRSAVPDRSGPTLPQPLNHKKQLGRHPSRLRRMVISPGWNTAVFPSITQTGTRCSACYRLLSWTRLNLLTLVTPGMLQPGSGIPIISNPATRQ